MNPETILKDPSRLGGLGVAIVTPLGADGAPATGALAALTRKLAAEGVDVFYPLGTTGEGALLTQAMRETVLGTVIDAAQGKCVIAGAGAFSTEECVEQTRIAKRLGAHGVLVVTPPYVKPTTAGLIRHYTAIACEGLPIVAYVVPGRTALAVSAADQEKLLAIDGVVAIKEASGNLGLMARVSEAAERLGKVMLVGDDALALPGIAQGAHGLVSVAGQLAPRSFKALVTAAGKGDRAKAVALQRRLIDLMDAMFWETNPLPVKQCLALRGQVEARWRLPLTDPSESVTNKLRELLARLDLLEAPFAGDDPARVSA